MSFPLGSYTPSALPVNIHTTLGALYIGNVVATALFGVTSVQTFFYFSGGSRDSPPLRIAVFVLWILDVVHVIMVCHEFYFYTVVNYGNLPSLLKITWSLVTQVIVTVVADSIIRGIFACRLWQLSGRNKPLMAAIIITSFTVLGSGLVFAVLGASEVQYGRLAKLSWIMYTCLGALALADVLISASLCMMLRTQETEFRASKSIIRTLMLYSVNTSALTSIFAVICLVTYATMPSNFIYQALFCTLSKLYLNSLLATLNARKNLREAYSTDRISLAIGKRRRIGGLLNPSRWTTTIDPESGEEVLGIQIETTTITRYDEDDGYMKSDTGHKESKTESPQIPHRETWTAVDEDAPSTTSDT